MRICVIGKFPPIEGGVSTRTYWTAHGLARRGHEVHVVTNAKEVLPPFRMHMRRQDWKRCEAAYPPPHRDATSGSVKVHWTDPVDNSQFYIPMASAFVSKLAATAARAHSEHPFDVIYSHYLEPYGIAGHLVADIANLPHVVRLAGSDAGRLWRHPQLEPLYDHVLRAAAIVIATGPAAGRAIKHGVRSERIAAGGSIELPEDLFHPNGPALDLAALRKEVELHNPELLGEFWGGFTGGLPFFGIYGKLGETKGSFALLAAMQRLKLAGLEVGLVAMAHGWSALERKFRARAEELGVADRILQIPFLPHWRVPEFLRSCLAVCCLEQNFPIAFHSPVIAREVLTCGSCLVGSTEVLRKLADHSRLPSGYGCIAIEDIQNVEALSTKLAAIVLDPEPIGVVGARGRAFARALPDAGAADRVDHIIQAASRRRVPSKFRKTSAESTAAADDQQFPITQLAAQILAARPKIIGERAGRLSTSTPIDLLQARAVLGAVEKGSRHGDPTLDGVGALIRLEIAVAEAEGCETETRVISYDSLFRLRTKRWALEEGGLARLLPIRSPQLRTIPIDLSGLLRTQLRSGAQSCPHHVAVFAPVNGERRDPLFISDTVARILELSDGTRTASQVATEIGQGDRGKEQALSQIENLFVSGLLWLCEPQTEAEANPPRIVESM